MSGNAANIGITELLDIQLKMLEDVSGVNGRCKEPCKQLRERHSL